MVVTHSVTGLVMALGIGFGGLLLHTHGKEHSEYIQSSHLHGIYGMVYPHGLVWFAFPTTDCGNIRGV